VSLEDFDVQLNRVSVFYSYSNTIQTPLVVIALLLFRQLREMLSLRMNWMRKLPYKKLFKD
jgi:hypothetical protein